MSLLPPDFHFLRPDWLYALLPAVLFAAYAWRRAGKGRDDWRGLVDAHLLRHLAVKDRGARGKWPVLLLALGWSLATLALAGPAWQKVPAPALDQIDPTVVIMSLAQSMNSTDQSPNRLTAARHKVDDLLKRMKGGQAALVIFADAPFVAAPLTEDGRVIAQMLPELATDLMPVLNDRPDLAIRQAVDLLKNTGATTGRILLVTNGPGDAPERTVMAARAAATAGYHVNVLGMGGESAVPLLGPDGRGLKGRDGSPLTTRLDSAGLREVAEAGRGRFERLAPDSRDLDALLAKPALPGAQSPFQQSGLVADQWVDMGPWVVLAVAVLASLAFRRGLIAAIALMLAGGLAVQPARAQATADPAAGIGWNEMWRTPDQRGADAFAAQDYGAAAGTFRDPAWQASSLYRAGDYTGAASTYARQPGADFNRGNALARAGQLQEAVAAYDAALAANPKDADAAFNRDLVLKALEQQKQNNNQQNQQNQGQGNDQQKSSGGGQDKKDQKAPPQAGDKGNDPNKGDPQQNQAGQQPDQKPQDQKGQDQKGQDQQGQDQKKPEPKPDPKAANPSPQKPDPAKPGTDKADQQPQPQPQPQPKDQPGKDQQGKDQQDAPFQPPPDPREAQGTPQGQVPLRPMTEQDQNREQTLRMVPDDPVGLLRARIRAHYTGVLRPTVEDPR